ncbi:GTPase [Candidatus Riesia pediculischaeffi]|nr:GTPase [Candidatus Riesia pediculischaeffi]
MIYLISALHKIGIHRLMRNVTDLYHRTSCERGRKEVFLQNRLHTIHQKNIKKEKSNIIRITIIGRQNVGKSTLINRILGENRIVVSDTPGTTRESIDISISKIFKIGKDRCYLTDTAGITKNISEKMNEMNISVREIMKRIRCSEVVLLLIDPERLTRSENLLINLMIKMGSSFMIVFNKLDKIPHRDRDKFRKTIIDGLNFVKFFRIHFISALYQDDFKSLLRSIKITFQSKFTDIKKDHLREIVENIERNHLTTKKGLNPDAMRLKDIRISQGVNRTLKITIFSKSLDKIKRNYMKYVENKIYRYLSEDVKMIGRPVKIIFKRYKSSNK